MSTTKIVFALITFFLLINTTTADEIILYPIEDTYVDSTNINTNFGDSFDLRSHSSTSTTQYVYLKFYVPQFSESSNLSLFVTGGFGADNIILSRISPDWDADYVTWNHGRPIMENWQSYIVATAPYTKHDWVTWNTSSVIDKPGYYAFLIRSQHGQQHKFNSTESGVNIPYMTIVTSEPSADIVHNTKTNDDSYAFKVETDDLVVFSTTDENVLSYNWFVNKVNQGIDLDSFTFSVPEGVEGQPSSQIWEIRVEGTYENSSTFIREWLISSLSEDEAPDFIEYFVDRNNVWRTGYITDPWGRELAYYNSQNNVISKGFLSGTATSTGNVLSTKFTIDDGTFKYKIRNPGVLNIYYFKVTDTKGYSWRTEWQSNEFHDYFAINNNYGYIPISRRWLGQAPGTHYWNNDEWLDITIIKTNEGWWTVYVDGVMMPHVHANFEDALSSASKLSLAANSLLELDCIEVYKDRYIYPPTTIEYGTYPKWWKTGETTYGRLDPVDEVGIKVSGKNVTLEQIADAIDNQEYISYDPNTRTAILKTNIALYDGSELIIDNEKLIVDTSDQSLSINPKVGVKLSIKDSTITATNYPMIWNFASSISENVYDPDVSRDNDAKTSQPRTNHIYDFRGQFIVENSTIDNTGNLFLDAPYEVTIRNVIFSNHSSIDYGDYTLRGPYENHNQKKRQSYGEKGLWIVPRMDLVDYVVENVTFVEPRTEISLKVIGGEWIQNATTIRDSDLRGVDISVMKALKYEYYQNYWNKNEKSTLALLNTLYDEEKLSIDGHPRVGGRYEYDEAEIITKYYLNAIVESSSSIPISGANLLLHPSTSKYPAESLYEYRSYIADRNGPGEGGVSGYGPGYFDENGELVGNMHNITYSGGTYTRWYNALPLDVATTDSNGHTALPGSDDPKNSIVLIDYVLTSDAGTLKKDSLTYTLNVNAPSGQLVSLTDISPDLTWYRENPNVPTYTITAIIPDSNTTGPSIIGFAPSEDNPFVPGNTKKFRVWTNEALTSMNWFVDGNLISTGSLEYNWDIMEGSHTIVFEGSNANGAVMQSWSITESAHTPAPESSASSGLSFTPSATSFTSSVGSSTTFNVDSEEQFTSAKWYFNGAEVASGTSYTQNWAASGSFTVRFDGVTDLGTLTRTWNVLVSGSEYSDISIIPSASIVKPGETFSLDLYIDPKQPVTGAQFNLHYGSLASVTSVKDGGLFKTGGLTNTFQSGTIDNSAGVLRNVYSAVMGPGTVTAPGSMAKVNMVAGSSTGMLELTMSNVVLSDAYSNPAPYDISYASVLVDTAPVFNTIPAMSVEEESTLAFTVSATDADGDILTYSCISLPEGATFDASAKTFRWMPSRGQAGTYSVQFSVTDGYLNDTAATTITVSTLDRTPVITLFEPASGSVFEEGRTIDMRVVAEDPEGKALSYIMTINGVQVSSSSSYQWVTDYSSAGTHSIGVTVSDGNSQASRTHTITITDAHPRWDVNQDGVVNILDITLVGQNYGRTYTDTLPRWDVNQDGIVNVQDMSIVAGRFGETVQ